MKTKPYRIVFYYLLILIRGFFNLFPYQVGVWVGRLLGFVVFYLLRKERNKMIGNLKLAFGDQKSGRELRRIAREVFENYGMIAAETQLVHKIIPCFDRWADIEGKEILDLALKNGHGAIGLIAHFGNWELMGGYLATKGYPMVAVARKIYYEKYNQLLTQVREKLSVKTIDRDQSPRQMLQALKNNAVLVIAADQDVESLDGVFANFFGRPAYTPIAPVRFSMATGAPIIPAFIIREGFRHRIIIEKPIELTFTGNKELDLAVNTQKWVTIQENYIRRYPNQWVWNHKRWKTKSV